MSSSPGRQDQVRTSTVAAGPGRVRPASRYLTGAKVLCLAHVTNTMGRTDEDFEKGEADGTAEALSILEAILQGTLAE